MSSETKFVVWSTSLLKGSEELDFYSDLVDKYNELLFDVKNGLIQPKEAFLKLFDFFEFLEEMSNEDV